MPYTDDEIAKKIAGESTFGSSSDEGRKSEILSYLRKIRKSDNPYASINQIHKEMSFSGTKRQNTYSAVMELVQEGKVKAVRNPQNHWRVWVEDSKIKEAPKE